MKENAWALFCHWSWVLVFVAMGFMTFPQLAVIISGVAFLHRHLTIVPTLRSMDTLGWIRLWALPCFCFLAFVWLAFSNQGEVKPFLISLGKIAAFWNVWHIISQKYGILRLQSRHDQKSKGSDRFIIYSWIPYFAVIIFVSGNHLFEGFLTDFDRKSVDLKNLTLIQFFVSGSYVVYKEMWKKKIHLLKLSMIASSFFLFSIFGFLDIQQAFIILVFGHSLEYLFFIPSRQNPVSSKVHFVLPVLLVMISVLYIFSISDLRIVTNPKTHTLISCWVILQSLAHFYWDGVLWKNPVKKSTGIN